MDIFLQELDILSLPENAEGQLTERNKRTIGVLRQLFPELSKVCLSILMFQDFIFK